MGIPIIFIYVVHGGAKRVDSEVWGTEFSQRGAGTEPLVVCETKPQKNGGFRA